MFIKQIPILILWMSLALNISYAKQVKLTENNSKQNSEKNKTEFHDVDPRNTEFGVGIVAYDNGDLKVTSNGGFTNLYGDGKYQTQLVFMAEYRTQSEQARLRITNFYERFAGLYFDFSLQDILDMYTVAYMVSLAATGSKAFF